MDKADEGHSKLTPEERIRNKRIGDINLYFVKANDTPLQRAELTEGQVYDAAFQSRDHVSGKVIGNSTLKVG